MLTAYVRLNYTVSNGTPAESIASVKQNAPQVYQAQDRMVSAQDYNVYPYAVNNNILKLKAINRTHSGHSRFIDINDQQENIKVLVFMAKTVCYIKKMHQV